MTKEERAQIQRTIEVMQKAIDSMQVVTTTCSTCGAKRHDKFALFKERRALRTR